MARPFIFSKLLSNRLGSGLAAILAVGVVLCVAVATCRRESPRTLSASAPDDKKWDRNHAEWEYRLLQVELGLAHSDSVYMVLDFRQNKLKLKQKGAVVWSYPMNFASKDSEAIGEFLSRFEGKEQRLIRPLASKHLFSAKEKTPDSVLAIVGEVVKVEPGTLQRELPQRFQLQWADGLIMEIRTDVSGKPVSKFQNALVEIGAALNRPFGETTIVLKVDANEALTLYAATRRGMPTLIYPSE